MYERCIVASVIWALVPRGTTRIIYLKSPPNTITFPPKGSMQPIISCNDLSNVSTACLRVIAISSHMIREVVFNKTVVPLYLVKLHMELSHNFIGILNLECVVRPPGIMDAAIPEVAVAIAISPREQTLANNALY